MCVLMFDELAITKEYFYDQNGDSIVGKENYGVFGRSTAPAAQELTFIVRSIRGGGKQSLGYVLSKSEIKADIVSKLLK